MASSNTTIDDTSPLITYEPADAWYFGDASTDPGTNYWKGTKTWTATKLATAAFRFNGTKLVIIGAKRSNHGPFTVRVDGVTYPVDGYAKPAHFQAHLFSSSDLMPGIHDVVITNTGGMYLDIDCISWSSNTDGDRTITHSPTISIVQDTDSSFRYGPSGAWNMNPQHIAQFNDSSGHSTFVYGAMVNLTFQGDAVSLYGTVGPDNAEYQVSLDNRVVGLFNAGKSTFEAQVLLYSASDLADGSHTLSLMNRKQEKLLEVDYALVAATPSTLPSSSSGPTPTGQSEHKSTALTGGSIAGITLGILFVILLLSLVWYLNRRNKHLWMRLQDVYQVQSQFGSTSTSPLISASHRTEASGVSEKGPRYYDPYTYQPNSQHYDPYAIPSPPPATSPQQQQQTWLVSVVNPPIRSDTAQTDTTLVAEDGSAVENHFSSAAIKLVPRWITLGRLSRERRDSASIAPRERGITRPNRTPSTKRLLLHGSFGEEDEDEIDPNPGDPVDGMTMASPSPNGMITAATCPDSPLEYSEQDLGYSYPSIIGRINAQLVESVDNVVPHQAVVVASSPPSYHQSMGVVQLRQPVEHPRGPRPRSDERDSI